MSRLLPAVVDSLRLVGTVEPALESIVSALSSAEPAGGLTHQSSTAGGIFEWAADVIALLAAVDPQCFDGWAFVRRALLSVVSTRDKGETMWHPTELIELVELTDLVEICG